MTIEALLTIVFVLFLCLLIWRLRKQIKIQRILFPILYIILYRSTFGISSMQKLARKFPRFLSAIGSIGIIIGFIGMIFIIVELISTSFAALTPGATPGIQPVLPFEAKGVLFVPFSYWILSIFLLALVHEFAHGVLSFVNKVPVKSSGFAFLSFILPFLPAAFVEPDEKTLSKKSIWKQLQIFSAGPFSNILFALLVVGILAILSPMLSQAFEVTGLEVTSITPNTPAAEAGLQKGEVLLKSETTLLTSVQNLSKLLSMHSPGEIIEFETTNRTIKFTLGSHPENQTSSYLGVQVKPHTEIKQEFVENYGTWIPEIIKWITGFFFWLFFLNIGIGLFNLLPLGPLDGGRMFQALCLKVFRKKTALRIWSGTSLFLVALILWNLLLGFVR